MAYYACLCPNCGQYHYTGWGVKKCPKCGTQMYQSRIEQATFERFSTEKKADTFMAMFPEGSNNYEIIVAALNDPKSARMLQAKKEEEIRRQQEEDALRQMEKDQEISKILISSGFSFEGYRIVKYSGYISGDDATTIPRLNGIFTANHGQALTDALVKIRIQALKELKEAAYDLGCNAIIGVDFDYLTLEPERASLLDGKTTIKEDYVICVTANGNAVVIEKI